MSQHRPFRATLWLSALCAAFLAPAMGKSPSGGKDKHQIRIVCVSSLDEKQAVILATTKDGKKFDKPTRLEFRASSVTDWLPVEAGELHLAVKDGNEVKSICRFTHPEDCSKGLVILVADLATKTYEAHFVDPKKAGFEKGTFLVSNFTTQPASVFLGPAEEKIEASQHVVVKPTLEGNGMFRMQVSRPGKDGKAEACHDRYTRGNQDSREFLFLIPDENSGLRVMSLPMFGDLE
jgi:hypothetical protein